MMKDGSTKLKPRVPQKGLRAQVAIFADYAEKESEFDEKEVVAWDQVDEFHALEWEQDVKGNDLLEKARYGMRAYEFYSNGKNRDRHLAPLFKATSILGLAILNNEDTRACLEQWWRERLHNKDARRNWSWFCEALDAKGRGLFPKLTVEKRKKNRRTGNLQAKQDARALQYCNKALKQYKERTNSLPQGGHVTRDKIAIGIAQQELTRGGEAKQEGVRLFLKEVKRELSLITKPTVSKKNSHFPT